MAFVGCRPSDLPHALGRQRIRGRNGNANGEPGEVDPPCRQTLVLHSKIGCVSTVTQLVRTKRTTAFKFREAVARSTACSGFA